MSFRRSKIPKFIPIISLLILLVLGPIVFSLLQNASGVEAAWVDDNFSYRNAIPITSHTAAENNVYISATIDTSASGQFQADCGDLRFTTVGGDILPYYIVSGCVSASTVVHVFFDTMPAGAQTLYYYYGNPSAANGFSSADFATVATNYAVGTVASQEKGGAPIAYWKFDDGTGTNAQDSSPNNNDGTITGATWQTEDQCISGKCLFFDEAGDNVNLGGNDNLTNNINDITIGAWVRLNAKLGTVNNNYEIISNESFQNYGYLFRVENTTSTSTAGKIHLRFSQAAAYTAITAPSNTYPDDHQWHYLVGVKEGSAGRIYLDGKLVYSASGLSNPVNASTSTYIGGNGQLWNGFLDEVKVFNYARTAAQIKSDFKSRGTTKGISVGAGSSRQNSDALSNGLVGYWKMDEVSGAGSTLADSSGNSNTGTAVLWGGGNTSTDSAHVAGKFGNSFSFDGGDDAITVPDATSLRFTSTTGVSVSAWVKMNATNQNDDIVSKMSGNNGIQLRRNSSGKFTWAIGNGTTTATSTNTSSLSTGTWYHVTGTFDRNTLYVYVNGVQEGSNTISGFSDDTAQLVIGNENQLSNNAYWDGTIDEVRIYNRALSPREVRDLYNWAPGPVGYWNFEEKSGTTAYDSSGYGNNTTSWNGSPLWSSGKYGSGLTFNGANNLEITANSNFNVRALTIESWIKTPSTMGGVVYRALFSKQGADRDYNWYTYSSDGTKVTRMHFSSARFSSHAYDLPASFEPNTWHHVAFTQDGDGNYAYYADGVKFASGTGTAAYANNSYNIWISRADNYWNGVQDELRFYNYARTQKQIVEDMNAGHPVGGSPVGSQVGYWRFDEGYGTNTSNSGNGGATYNATLASSPNAPTWNNEGKYGKALNFDGSNDYATINTSLPTLTEGSISMWVKRTATTGTYQMLFTDSGSQFEVAWINASTLTFYVNNVGVSTSTAASLNIWYHITGTFSETGNYQRIYVNGVLANSSTYPGDATTATRYFGSRAGSYPFAGSIDEIKVYNSALTEDEIKLDYNRGQAMVLGTLSDTSGLTGGSVASSSASAEYCIPGDTATCTPPVARWDFEEGSGISTYDSSGNGNTGTLTSGPTWTSGKSGKGLNFDGTDGKMIETSKALSNFITNSEGTVEVWMKPVGSAVSNAAIYQLPAVVADTCCAGGYFGIFRGNYTGVGDGIYVYNYDGSVDYVRIASYNVNEWVHITWVHSGGILYAYKNGILIGSTASGNTGALTYNLRIGDNGSSSPFTGQVRSGSDI